MSFILDALKKSESERQRQSGPGVFQPRIASPRARFPVWALALGLLLGINLLVLLWVMTRPEPPRATPVAAATPAAQPAPAAPASTAATVPAAGATAAATPVGTRFNPPLIVDPTLADDGNATAGAPPAATPTPASGAFNPNDYLPAQPGPANPVAAPPATTTTATAATTAPGAASNYATREALVARGQNVPDVALSLHVYDADPARRFVFVNGQRGRDGDTLPNGLRIEQILPEGAVLSWNGNRFFAPLQ